MIPVTPIQWTEEVCQALWLDKPVRVRVYKVRFSAAPEGEGSRATQHEP